MMRRMWCCTWRLSTRVNWRRWAASLITFVIAGHAYAAVPDWMRQAAQAALPSYPDDTDAVVLLNERINTVTSAGEVRTTFRKAYKILRPKGRSLGTVIVYFDNDTQLAFLKGWSITGSGEYEVKEKDAVETSILSEALFADTRYKLLQIPSAEPGSVIGYEYQQRQRPSIMQDMWDFQEEIPTRRARYILELPPGWTYSAKWLNHAPVAPQSAGENKWSWELNDIGAIESEPDMPTWQSVAGHLGISFGQPQPASSKNYETWDQVAAWFRNLSSDRRQVTPQISEKARSLTSAVNDPIEKIRGIASYVQHGIRYVAVEIGIGGYRPHSAQETFSSGYGDCKDKATLLITMLRVIGVDSYYVLIHSDRDFVDPDFPTMLTFNHVIVAIRLPKEVDGSVLFARFQDQKEGRLLFFDPTDSTTPLGYLPPNLQANQGLLVTDDAGGLVKLPLLPGSTNRILRVAKLMVDKSGNLQGSVQEVRTGAPAASMRRRLLAVPKAQRASVIENQLSELLDGAVLTAASVLNLEEEGSLVLQYSLAAPGYAQQSGSLLLLRPCALGHRSSDILEGKARKQPVEYEYAALEGDIIDISYPPEYSVDELPSAVNYDSSFAAYRSEIGSAEKVLHYSRTFEIKEVRVPVEKLEDLKKLYRQAAADERAYAVLKTPPPANLGRW